MELNFDENEYQFLFYATSNFWAIKCIFELTDQKKLKEGDFNQMELKGSWRGKDITECLQIVVLFKKKLLTCLKYPLRFLILNKY